MDIIKHACEKNSKSTSPHAYLVSPGQVRIFGQFEEIPIYRERTNSLVEENVVVVCPSEDSVLIESYVAENGPIQRLIFLDSTWFTLKKLKYLPQIKNLPFVRLKNYNTKYWRQQVCFFMDK